jgi:hypothetical protein
MSFHCREQLPSMVIIQRRRLRVRNFLCGENGFLFPGELIETRVKIDSAKPLARDVCVQRWMR